MSKPNPDKTEFWVCNISDRNVTLSDLRVSIPRGKGVNLLSKHYSYSYEELKESMEKGSIFAKRDKIKVSKGPPEKIEAVKKTKSKFPIITRNRSAVKLEEEIFEDDFIFSDEQYAEQMTQDLEDDF